LTLTQHTSGCSSTPVQIIQGVERKVKHDHVIYFWNIQTRLSQVNQIISAFTARQPNFCGYLYDDSIAVVRKGWLVDGAAWTVVLKTMVM
jgi:hypothetical protein